MRAGLLLAAKWFLLFVASVVVGSIAAAIVFGATLSIAQPLVSDDTATRAIASTYATIIGLVIAIVVGIIAFERLDL